MKLFLANSRVVKCSVKDLMKYQNVESILAEDIRNDDNNIKFFKNFGHVLFDFKEYEKEVFLLKNYGSY